MKVSYIALIATILCLVFACPVLAGSCECSNGSGCRASAECTPPQRPYCICEPPKCEGGCYKNPPMSPMIASSESENWSWLEVARTLQREVVVSDKPTTIRNILKDLKTIENVIVYTGTNEAALDNKIHNWHGTVMDLLRKLSNDMNGNVLLAGLAIPSKPSLSSTVNLHAPGITPPTLYVLLWGYYGIKVEYLLNKATQYQEFDVLLKNVPVREVEETAFDQTFFSKQ